MTAKHGWHMGAAAGQYISTSRKAAKFHGIRKTVKLYKSREAAVMLRRGSPWIRRQINSGKMKAVRYGNAFFITNLEISRWMGLLGRGSNPFLARRKTLGPAKRSQSSNPGSATRAFSVEVPPVREQELSAVILGSDEGEPEGGNLLRAVRKGRVR